MLRGGPPTQPERDLYRALEAVGVRFVQQRWIGPYRCDAFLPELGIVIEADGDYIHTRPAQRRKDKRKDAYYRACGYQIARVWGSELARDALGWAQRLVRRARAATDDGAA